MAFLLVVVAPILAMCVRTFDGYPPARDASARADAPSADGPAVSDANREGSAQPADGGKQRVFVATADSYVKADAPLEAFGDSTHLRIDGTPVWRGIVRFDLTSISGKSVTAVLGIYGETAATAGYDVHAVAQAGTWSESTVTWSNAPSPGPLVGSAAPWTTPGWTNVDVSSAVKGPQVVEFILSTTHVTQVRLSSREGIGAPRLTVNYH